MTSNSKKYDRPVAFHRCFVRVTGTTQSALMLSQALYWSYRTTSDKGWFYKTREEWEDETGLTKNEQKTVRDNLLTIATEDGRHLWEEEFTGVPPKLYFRVNEDVLDELVDSGWIAPKRHTGKSIETQLTSKQSVDPVVSQLSTTSSVNGRPGRQIYTETTTETTTENIYIPSCDGSVPQADANDFADTLFQQEDIAPVLLPQKKARKAPKADKPAKTNDRWEFITLLAEVCGMDAKVNAGMLGSAAKRLAAAEYTIDDVKWFAEKTWPKDWRAENGQKINIAILNMGIKQAKEERLKAPPQKTLKTVIVTDPFTGEKTTQQVMMR